MKISKAFWLIFSGSFLWAVSIVASKFLFNRGENPLNLVFWTSVAAAPLWLAVLFRNRSKVLSLTRNDLILLFFIGLGCSLSSNILEMLAIKYTSAVNFSFLIRTVVLFTIIVSAIAFREKITAGKMLLGVMIVVGSYLLATNGGGTVFQPGDLITLAEAIVIAVVNTLLIKRAVNRIHPDTVAAGSFFAGLIPVVGTSLANHTVSPPQNPWIIVLIALMTVIFIQLRNRAYRLATPTFITMIASFTPVFTCILSFLLFGETLRPIQLLGGLMIISTGFLAELLKI